MFHCNNPHPSRRLAAARVQRPFAVWLVCLVILPAIHLTTLIAAAQSRPNIVLILADDLGYETVGCYGGASYPTPHLDDLAAGGLRFDRAYAMPLCTNTRIQLMTGKYNLRNWSAFGILDPHEKTFAHLLQAAGYQTCMAGKWQLTSYDPPDYPGAAQRRSTGMRVSDAGFDEYSLWHTGHTEDKGSRYARPVIEQNGKLLTDTEDKYGPDIWTDFIGDFMRRNRESPFFVYYSMALPHNPMNPTPDSPEWADPRRRSEDATRFAADMIRYTDKMVGKVVGQLEELGLREKTLVLFFSDNGTNSRVRSNFRGRIVHGEKGQGTEFGIRVPAIANWPGTIQAGRTTQALVDSVDFLPTLLDEAGARELLPDGLDGTSLGPLLRGTSDSVRDHVYVHQDPRPGWDKDRYQLLRLAIGPRYKLYEDGRMFDVVQDMFEEQPLWVHQDNSAQAAARRDLQRALDSYRPYRGFDPDSVPRPDPNSQARKNAFEDQGGLVVIEAEQIPFFRDESWVVENNLPDYSGTGYLRTIRAQAHQPTSGGAPLTVALNTAGDWRIAVRCRTDHPLGQRENEFWWRQADGNWRSAALPADAEPGKWTWVLLNDGTPMQLQERRNEFSLAPKAANLKIDRVVLFQPEERAAALDPQSPCSPFHPWTSP